MDEFPKNGHWDCFAACLKTPRAIDWTIPTRDEWKQTTLQSMFDVFTPEKRGVTAEEWQRVLSLVLDRLEAHGPCSAAPDQLEWGQKNACGHDCLSAAAYWGHLALFWNVVVTQRRVKYFLPHPSPFQITGPVQKTDMDQLQIIVGTEGEFSRRFVFSAGIKS